MEPAVVWHSPEVKVGPSREGLRAPGRAGREDGRGTWGKERTRPLPGGRGA